MKKLMTAEEFSSLRPRQFANDDILDAIARALTDRERLARHEGTRDCLCACGQAAIDALGFDDDHDSPTEVKAAIESIYKHLDRLRLDAAKWEWVKQKAPVSMALICSVMPSDSEVLLQTDIGREGVK